jgi:hypothetical protein
LASEAFYRNAAKSAWVAPVVVVALNLLGQHGQADPAVDLGWKYKMVSGGIALALILTGFIAGIVALCGIRAHRRVSIAVPAVIGVSINGLVIFSALAVIHLGNRVTTSSAAEQARQQRWQQSQIEMGKADARMSLVLFGGWVGKGSTPTAQVALTSLDDQSPTARRVLDVLPVPCSVVVIVTQSAPGRHDMTIEPSSLTLKFADGHVVHALDGGAIFSRAKKDPTHELLKLNSAHQFDPTKEQYEAFALIPPGVDMRQVRSATLRVNGSPATISGRYLTDVEKREMFPPE